MTPELQQELNGLTIEAMQAKIAELQKTILGMSARMTQLSRQKDQLRDKLQALQDEPQVPMCPPHQGLLKAGNLGPFDNCVACIRNHRDTLIRVLDKIVTEHGAALPPEMLAEARAAIE